MRCLFVKKNRGTRWKSDAVFQALFFLLIKNLKILKQVFFINHVATKIN